MKFAEYLKNLAKVAKEETAKFKLEVLKAKAEKQGFSLVKQPTKKEGK